ncbi:ribonuclease H-like protein [Rhizoclosmatium globosum]|uniref:Ribonuclease H-like protein n=1 Tax=Rhizoclosmatium globosum TaxID=329046 RepID=A0A1Y2CAS3_9FUNG|nr:ribonuclease H-like protein [Rhizoclosmatium globosum]|eukprot:ORY43987.1 ribonuclease H-like protein [Rhizoclosmatium globosum]
MSLPSPALTASDYECYASLSLDTSRGLKQSFNEWTLRRFSPAEFLEPDDAAPDTLFEYNSQCPCKLVHPSQEVCSFISTRTVGLTEFSLNKIYDVIDQDGIHQRCIFALHADGGCSNNGLSNARASYGVAGIDGAWYESCGLLPKSEPQTSQRAELYAAKIAFEAVEKIMMRRSPKHEWCCTTVVIMMDSNYVVEGLCSWIRKWRRNGFRNSNGGSVVNADLFNELDAKVKWFWDKHGLRIAFWHIPRQHNKRADYLADKALREKGYIR